MYKDDPGFPTRVGPFIIGDEIGSGAFSHVYKGVHIQTNIEVAIKVIDKSKFLNDSMLTRFSCEISLLKQMDHPMINQLYYVYENEMYHFLVMELSQNGDLLTFVNKNGKLIEPIARRHFVQLFSVIEYLHNTKKVAHRDLKAENILLDQYFNIRVIDFGLSKVFEEDSVTFSTKCGSPAYVPPEMIRGRGYSTSIDTWSAGILLYAMTVGRLPFDHENVQQTLRLIVEAPPHIPSSLSPALSDLITRMLVKNPEGRITLEKIKEHSWFSKLEYDAITEYLKKLEEVKCDPDIVQQMEDLGIDTDSLRQNLFLGVFDETTAVYRMLRKIKVTNEMKTAMRARSVNSNATPQPSKMVASNVVAKPGRVIQNFRPDNAHKGESSNAAPPKMPLVRPLVLRAIPQNSVRRNVGMRCNSVRPETNEPTAVNFM